jgi:hypothetical protein
MINSNTAGTSSRRRRGELVRSPTPFPVSVRNAPGSGRVHPEIPPAVISTTDGSAIVIHYCINIYIIAYMLFGHIAVLHAQDDGARHSSLEKTPSLFFNNHLTECIFLTQGPGYPVFILGVEVSDR